MRNTCSYLVFRIDLHNYFISPQQNSEYDNSFTDHDDAFVLQHQSRYVTTTILYHQKNCSDLQVEVVDIIFHRGIEYRP